MCEDKFTQSVRVDLAQGALLLFTYNANIIETQETLTSVSHVAFTPFSPFGHFLFASLENYTRVQFARMSLACHVFTDTTEASEEETLTHTHSLTDIVEYFLSLNLHVASTNTHTNSERRTRGNKKSKEQLLIRPFRVQLSQEIV